MREREHERLAGKWMVTRVTSGSRLLFRPRENDREHEEERKGKREEGGERREERISE